MNLRNVLRAYSLLRQLSESEAAILDTLRQISDSERQMFVEALSDKPQKKSSKKGAGKGGGKSKHASSLQQQISGRAQSAVRLPEAATIGDVDIVRCIAMIDDNGGETQCGETVDNNVHHKQTDPNYHPFVPPASPATNPSSANGEVTDSTASSGMETGAAGVAHHGASGGD